MATTFRQTLTYSNLTRLELEQLRRSDFQAGGKALTVGDSGLLPEGILGAGDINAEPYDTTPTLRLDDVYGVPLPASPAVYLLTTSSFAGVPSETVRWYGPQLVGDGTAGYASGAVNWEDDSPGINFTLNVQQGDMLLIKATSQVGGGGNNRYAVGWVDVVNPNTLDLDPVKSYFTPTTEIDPDTLLYSYVIARPSAIQLFAVPGSGPKGREQTFMMVQPTSTLHNTVGPTIFDIEADRVTNIVPPSYSATGDRADSVLPIDNYLPFTTLDKCGYRVVLYPDDGSGTAPDLYAPILTDHPVIDPAVAPSDQRMTIDYKAGIVRFSCAPALGGDINTGGVNATTGRLNLYAVFWAVDQSLTAGAAQQLWKTRGDRVAARAPGRIAYDSTRDVWVMGTTFGLDDFFVRSLSALEDPTGLVQFGALDSSSLTDQERGFTYRRGSNLWTFTQDKRLFSTDPVSSVEMEVGQKLSRTVGDITSPPMAQADWNSTNGSPRGARNTEDSLTYVLAEACADGFSTVHLRKGKFFVNTPLVIPPGVTVEGEGAATKLISIRLTSGLANATQPVIKFGPNTSWGVYDPSIIGPDDVNPTRFQFTPGSLNERIEGMDVVWNSVRRVWAVVYADVTAQAVWFNEIGADGIAKFPGLGVDIKDSANALFTNDTPGIGVEHTPGHYPRIAHQQWTDEYAVVWVIKVGSGSGDGPMVVYQGVSVNIPLTPTGVPTVTKKLATPSYITGIYTFTDHPSIAVDNSTVTGVANYTIAVSCWSYDADVTVGSAALKATAPAGLAPIWTYEASANIAPSVVSSTDVDEDGRGGFLFVWSRRAHQLIMGTKGSILTPDSTDGSALYDPDIPDFSGLGIKNGSKFLYLGLPQDDAWTWDSHAFLMHPYNVTAYGTDGTVKSAPTTSVGIKMNATGDRYGQGTPWRACPQSANGTGNTTFTLTDTTPGINFTTLGIQVGDIVFKSTDYGDVNRRGYVVTAVAPGGLVNKLTLDRVLTTGGDPFTYDIWVGRVFNWAISPLSCIYKERWYPAAGGSGETMIVGTYQNNSTITFVEAREADLVRISRGGDKWLLVYQAFDTTSILAGKAIRNFDDGISASYPDNGIGLRVQDTLAPYREHIATCSVLLNDDGTPPVDSGTNTMAQIEADSSYYLGRISRDIEISRRSLGAHDPLTRKPNYYNNDSSHTTFSTGSPRAGQHMAKEVSALNFMHRWTANHPPGLLPDVTWSGQDWTVVSPAKLATHSFTGTCKITGGGDVIFGDPTFYFGDNNVDGSAGYTYLRQTVTTSDQIYFLTSGTSAYILSVKSEHCVHLASNPLGLGPGASEPNLEWVLIRGGAYPGSAKNAGFRVSAKGELIISTTFNTYADPIPVENLSLPNRTDLMRRVEEDTFQRGLTRSDGWNLPGNLSEDILEPQSRYYGDVGFQGVCVGQPKSSNRLVLAESPCCAISWGDNLFGFVDRWKLFDQNEVRFYRQSFGPYNNTVRNLSIEGATPQQTVARPNELKILSRQHVYTRHYGPVCSQGNFATDGYRNCFVYADTQGLKAVYTDALGGNPVVVEGPRPQLDATTITGALLASASGLAGSAVCRAANPAAPKVIWDGTKFVAAWVEGGAEATCMVCLGTFPGDENGGLQTSEMLDPNDLLTSLQTAQAVRVDYRKTNMPGEGNNYLTHLTVLDIAFSGKVYAVLWVNGLDEPVDTFSYGHNTGAAIGVTLFDDANFGSGLDADLRIITAGNTDGMTNNNTTFTCLTLDRVAFKAQGVRVGDVLFIRNGIGQGRYRIMAVSQLSLTVDRIIPAASGQAWEVHRRLMPSGGRTYVIGVTPGYDSLNDQRDAYVTPNIIWDGKQFVAVWRGRQWDDRAVTIARARSLQRHFIPEMGLGSVTQIIRAAAPHQMTVSGQPKFRLLTGTAIFTNGNATVTGWLGSTKFLTEVSKGDWIWAQTQGASYAAQVFSVGSDSNVVLTAPYTGGTVTDIPRLANAWPSKGIGWLDTDSVNATWIHLNAVAWGNGDVTAIGLSRDGSTAAPGIMVGDTLVVTSIWRSDLGYVTDHNGWYTITGYDPENNAIRVYPHTFGDITVVGDYNGIVYGAILSSGVGDQSQAYSMSDCAGEYPANTTPHALSLASPQTSRQDYPHDFGPGAGTIDNGDWATYGGAGVGYDPETVYGVVYNEVKDEYAVLFGDRTNRLLYMTTFKRGVATARAVVTIHTMGQTLAASLGWNGRHYLVALSETAGVAIWKLLNENLGLEETGLLCLSPGGGASIWNVCGSAVWQKPGPVCYGGYNSGALLLARVRNLHVEWNSRLNRWIVSLSHLWYSDEPTGAGANSTILTPWYLVGTVTSMAGRVLQFPLGSAAAIANYAQPGCKLLIYSGPMVAAYTILAADSGTQTITVDTTRTAVSGITAIDPAGANAYVIPREDVWCFSLGYDTPAVQFLDADGSSLENVFISGSPVDIEERYVNMARPILQSGGSMIGRPTATAYDGTFHTVLASIQRQTQHNSRLLVPTLKVDLPRFSNVRSRTKIKYGHGLTPGEPSFDRYAFGDRNRKG